MKNTIITLLSLTAFSFLLVGVNSCCKDKTPVIVDTNPCNFNTESANYEWVFADTGNIDGTLLAFANLLPAGSALDSVNGSKVASTVAADLKAQGIDTCQVQRIIAQNLRVKIDSPAAYNFDVLDSIWLYISKKDGSAKQVIGNKGSIPLGTKEVIMNLTPDFDISQYVLADSFRFQLGARRSNTLVSYTQGKMYLNFSSKFVGTYWSK